MDTVELVYLYGNGRQRTLTTQKMSIAISHFVFLRIPTMIAADYRTRKGMEIIDPRGDLSFSGFSTCVLEKSLRQKL